MTELPSIVFQVHNHAIQIIKMTEEDFLNASKLMLHVMKVTKIMDFNIFVFIVAKFVFLDSKTTALELNVFQSMLYALKVTKMMED